MDRCCRSSPSRTTTRRWPWPTAPGSGLQAAVFTSSLERAFWYTDRIRSGTVVVNDSTDFWETFQPFGGAAGTDTGWGRGKVDEFTDLQTMVINLDNV